MTKSPGDPPGRSAGAIHRAAPLRLGGEGRLTDGSRLLWSIAEGARGRRWRATRVRDGRLEAALLLELDRAGRPSRLELATPDGLLTLHPAADGGALHGNLVSPGGVRPLEFAWSPDHELDVAGFPIPLATGLHRRRAPFGVGEEAPIEVIAVSADLAVSPARRRVRRREDDAWLVAAGPDEAAWELYVDGDGLPRAERRWELEP